MFFCIDVHPVPDIECTENDLAFLKHMKNVKALAKLRVSYRMLIFIVCVCVILQSILCYVSH